MRQRARAHGRGSGLRHGLSFPHLRYCEAGGYEHPRGHVALRQSVFADAVDAVQAVDLTFDALVSEIDVSKMRVFLSDVLFDREKSGDKTISIPFGRQDCTVFRKVMSTEDTIQEFAPALRTSSQSEAFRIALQMLGDLCGFGLGYFDFDESRGYVRTATEVSSDNSA